MSLFRPEFRKISEITEAERQRLPTLVTELGRRLQTIAAHLPQAAFTFSLVVEDMVITDTICHLKLLLRIITLNTGKLNPEAEALIAATEARYQMRLGVFAPDKEAAATLERKFDVTTIYDSVKLRRCCYYIRKIGPLNRALENAPTQLTGQRHSQSGTRSKLNFEESGCSYNIPKLSPTFDWGENDVQAYVKAYDVPLSELYHQGYSSVGYESRTRPIKEGEDTRAGCWWWESKDNRERSPHKQNEQLRQHRKHAVMHPAPFIPAQVGIRRTPRLQHFKDFKRLGV